MAKDSKIEWTHHTFNPWWGCTKVSEACTYCYAESWAKRLGSDIWGTRNQRRLFGEAHWQQPITWNHEAEKEGKRKRVFCASMADVFENRPELVEPRTRLWAIIESTPWLDWLLLTKRPELIERFVPWTSKWPENIWLGTTAESQEWANKRIPILLSFAAKVRFVSCEPLLSPIDISLWLPNFLEEKKETKGPSAHFYIDWVIAGGESGPHARPMNPIWVKQLKDQCVTAGVPFHFKQWGNWKPIPNGLKSKRVERQLKDKEGNIITLINLGKKLAGRELNGKTWDEFPTTINSNETA